MAQSGIANKWWSHDSNPGSLVSESTLWTQSCHLLTRQAGEASLIGRRAGSSGSCLYCGNKQPREASPAERAAGVLG